MNELSIRVGGVGFESFIDSAALSHIWMKDSCMMRKGTDFNFSAPVISLRWKEPRKIHTKERERDGESEVNDV